MTERRNHAEAFEGRKVGVWEFPFKYQGKRWKIGTAALAISEPAEKRCCALLAGELLRSLR